MNTSKKTSREGKLSKYLRATVRMLMKARDSYIRGMTECSDKIAYGTVMGCPTGQVNAGLPKSYSVNSTRSSNDEDFRELIRAASTRSLGNKIESDLLRRQQMIKQYPTTGTNKNNMPRSYSVVGIGRIDEDETCDFGGDVKVKTDLFTRSRSYAITKRTGLYSS